MEFKKDELFEVFIEDIGAGGEGIGKVDGFTLFVKDAVIGDVVKVKIIKVKKHYAYARMLEVLKPSKYRTEPKCPIYKQCGGCQLQAVDYEEQLRFKNNLIRNHLIRIGKFENPPMLPIIGMDEPYYYRNKAQFPIGTDKEGKLVAGFYASRSHNIIPNRKCYLGSDVNEKVLDILLDYMQENHVSAYNEADGSGLVRHVLIRTGFVTKEIMVCVVLNGRRLPNVEALTGRLRKIEGMTSITLNVNTEKTNVILGREIIPVWNQTYITDFIGTIKYQISPLSFYQVNPVQTKKLYEEALDYANLTGNETVWDLYCGIGTISLFLAQKAKQVYGVEIIPEAIEDARKNADINGIKNAQFFVGKAEEVLPQMYEEKNICADVIVVDPPRKGCDEKLLDTIVKMEPLRVVYVSCDSATLARDLRYLCDRGYELQKARGCDQFCQTVHVECVCLMTRNAK